MSNKIILDIKNIPNREVYIKILDTLDILEQGDIMEIIHDHDPEVMRDQLSAIRPGMFEWSYVEKGPFDWRIDIKKTATSPNEKGYTRLYKTGHADGYPPIH